MARPPAEYFDGLAEGLSRGALENIEDLFAKYSLLPFTAEQREVTLTLMRASARQLISAVAELALTGTDVTHAVLPNHCPESNPPPSPV